MTSPVLLAPTRNAARQLTTLIYALHAFSIATGILGLPP
jgi:hypothetical protein